MISDLISTDISHGFTSAQLAVIKNGRLVYENAWGKTNSYLPDGKDNESSPQVTTDTLYDLASLTKMFSVNYALQKLVTDDQISLDARIIDFLGTDFAEDTIIVPNEKGETPEADLDEIKKWKAEVTIRDLLRHQGGFPADPKYSAPTFTKMSWKREKTTRKTCFLQATPQGKRPERQDRHDLQNSSLV